MYKAIASNKRNTLIIMSLFIGIIGAIGYVVSLYYGDTRIVYWVLAVALLYSIIQYFAANSLAVATIGAREIEKSDNPRFYNTIENLSITLGMPMPKVYIIDDQAPNAFASGRDPKHAIVGATSGLLEIMNDRELQSVMAHEMSHVKNYDIRVSMIAFGLVSVIGFLSDIVLRMLFWGNDRREDNNPIVYLFGIVILILSPIIATIVQLAINRQREYLADASGVMTTRDADGMISALEKLKQYSKPMKEQHSATANLFFTNPLKSGFIGKLFSTHPPLDERISRLQNNANKF
jgi:heat shock protein HtpX